GIAILIPWQFSTRSNRPIASHRSERVTLWRNRIAWYVTGYMGMQSFVFFATTGWLPTYLIAEGMDEQRAGFMLSLSPLFGVAGSFIAPLLVYKRHDQRWLVWLSSAFCAIGLMGMVVFPTTGTILWVSIFGFGSGMTLSIALTFIGLRTPDSRHAAELSMMSQAVGYSIAATGPILIGLAHDLVGNWQIPFALILLSTALLTWVGIGGDRTRLVTDIA
ncbi:MAG: MFS transporter, partial [Thermomicrobiales bacterium]|nr:MFS transporter [Thermomicrobiales bacterium]